MSLQIRERNFEKVGGLKDHIQTLKEMIIYPLLYKELFESHGIEAPRGVLFHGPPGTGKTLVAGAVAAECSRSTSRRVAFYMRKGADCLNKYVGESEKHLQNLFTQAQNTSPSIIFFDEIDGLVPTRSECQEQVHASVVSTLLALMDGLDSKSEVFVIGATNRIDMIDPALRRPGRFDRELYFPLPSLESRYQIFHIHTRNWKFKPDPDFLLKFASECVGYCGADIQSLCSQAVMESFRRNFPQVSDTTRKIQANLRNIRVKTEDFWAAKEKLVPASQRVFTVPSRPLSPDLQPLLKRSLDVCLDFILKSCPFKFIHRNRPEFAKNKSITCPRVLLSRNDDKGHIPYLASAVLHNFDHLPVTVIDLTTINDQPVRCSDSSSLVQKFKQAKQSMPGIIYFPDIGSSWDLFDETGKMVLMSSLEKLDSNSSTQLFLLATSNSFDYDDLPPDIQKLFPKSKALPVSGPVHEERYKFFSKLFQTYLHQQQPTAEESETKKINLEAQRRSRRQKGLDAEYLGISFVSTPKLGSYYRKYLDEKPIFDRNPNLIATSVKRTLETNKRPVKKLKTENFKPEMMSELSKEPLSGLPEDGYTDDSKVKDLAKLCVQATLNGQTESVVKLYEQLEIILLRFTSTWERSHLLQELEREITSFTLT